MIKVDEEIHVIMIYPSLGAGAFHSHAYDYKDTPEANSAVDDFNCVRYFFWELYLVPPAVDRYRCRFPAVDPRNTGSGGNKTHIM